MRCYRRQLKTTVIIEGGGGGGGGTSTITIERLGESSLTIIKGDAATIEFILRSLPQRFIRARTALASLSTCIMATTRSNCKSLILLEVLKHTQ